MKSKGGLHDKCQSASNISQNLEQVSIQAPYNYSICLLSTWNSPLGMVLTIERFHKTRASPTHQSVETMTTFS
jgi:hypothetical protein